MKRKLICNHSIRYMDRVFAEYPRKYSTPEMRGLFFRAREGEIRCAALDPGSTIVEPDGVKTFSGEREEWIYKL